MVVNEQKRMTESNASVNIRQIAPICGRELTACKRLEYFNRTESASTI